MLKTVLIFFSAVILIFSCSNDPSFEEDPYGPDRPGGGRYGGSLQECEGAGWLVYSYEDCMSLKEGLESDRPQVVDTMSNAEVDILFVIDGSRSMNYFLAEEEMRNKFQSFISDTKHLDSRILFTSARYYRPQGFSGIFRRREGLNGKALNLQNAEGLLEEKYLTADREDYEEVFFHSLSRSKRRGECRLPPGCTDRNEQPLKALRSSFLSNQDLLRESADFAAVIITNTDEARVDSRNEGDLVESVVREFETVFGNHKRLFVFSIIVLPERGMEEMAREDRSNDRFDDRRREGREEQSTSIESSCLREQKQAQPGFLGLFRESAPGLKISELARKTGGGNFSICLRDFSVLSKAIVRAVSQ